MVTIQKVSNKILDQKFVINKFIIAIMRNNNVDEKDQIFKLALQEGQCKQITLIISRRPKRTFDFLKPNLKERMYNKIINFCRSIKQKEKIFKDWNGFFQVEVKTNPDNNTQEIGRAHV